MKYKALVKIFPLCQVNDIVEHLEGSDLVPPDYDGAVMQNKSGKKFIISGSTLLTQFERIEDGSTEGSPQ